MGNFHFTEWQQHHEQQQQHQQQQQQRQQQRAEWKFSKRGARELTMKQQWKIMIDVSSLENFGTLDTVAARGLESGLIK